MQRKFTVVFAALTLLAAGCESKSSDDSKSNTSKSTTMHDEIRGIGGGPSSSDESTNLNEDTQSGTSDHPGSGDPEHGAESLAGGGTKTTNGAVGPSMVEKKSDAGTD